jgi:Radical SAM superfamily
MIETSRQLLELELTLGAQTEFAAHCPVHTDGRSTFQRVAGLGELKMKFPRTQPAVQPMSQPNMVRPAGSESFSIGLGLTNDCNLACSFCYRDPTRVDRLSLEQVQAAMASLPVRSVNLGTGENSMHPEFHEILVFLRTLPVKLTITSNGPTRYRYARRLRWSRESRFGGESCPHRPSRYECIAG